jgi:glycerol-3-phosphate acyltransferase PlsY
LISPFNLMALLLAYLMGSIPTAVWIGKIFYSIDVREFGSGNAGATNTFRVLGKKAGIPVLLLDVLKGYGAVQMATWMGDLSPGSDALVNLQLALGMAAFLGHLFPVYEGFRGGKGVATLLGIVLALHWSSALLSIACFLLVFIMSGYVSLASISAALFFPISLAVIFQVNQPTLVLFGFTVSIVLLITHQKNIERLLKRKENRMVSWKRS